MAKICIICNEDCSNEPRFKNEDGHYVCARCYATQQDNDQQQVDDTEAPTPFWAVFCRYLGVAIFVVGLVSVTAAAIYAYSTMGLDNPWFPHDASAAALIVAVLYTAFLLHLCASEPRLRFWSYFFKILLSVPIIITTAYIESFALVPMMLWFFSVLVYSMNTVK